MKTLITLAALMMGASSFAQIPTGNFTGFVSNNSFQDLCNLNQGDIEFFAGDNGAYTVRWEEQGFFRYPASGFCQNNFDATLTPSGKANEWNVSFNYNYDMIFGKAVLRGDTLEITASYSGSNRAFQRFNARMKFNQGTLNYNRTIDRWGGSSLYANGSLRQ